MTNKITDRACYIMETEFHAEYVLEGENLSDKTIKSRISKLLQRHVDQCYSNQDRVPLVLISEVVNQKPIILEKDNKTKVMTLGSMTMCIEDADDNPKALGKNMTMLFFDSLKLPAFRVTNAYLPYKQVGIKNEMRGYIQLDNSVFIPIT